jgi:hypothetical protein
MTSIYFGKYGPKPLTGKFSQDLHKEMYTINKTRINTVTERVQSTPK